MDLQHKSGHATYKLSDLYYPMRLIPYMIPLRNSILISVLFLLFAAPVSSQVVKGVVVDEEGAPVPFATVYVLELHRGTTANEEGFYQLSLPLGSHDLRFQYLGYKTQIHEVLIGDEPTELNVVLEVQHYTLPAVVVTASGEDPAYYIMRRAIGLSQYYLNQVSEYSCRVYLKGSGVILNVPGFMRLQLEREGVEEGRYFVVETISDVYFELPDRIRTEVRSLRSSGNDNQSDPMSFVTISLYRDINGIISPLSRSAMQLYRFELAGSFLENGHQINRIRVIPRRSGPDLYQGYIYIREGSWNLHSVDLSVEQSLFTINIRQVYQPVSAFVWMPVSQNFEVSVSMMGFEIDYTYVASVSDYEITLNPDLDHSFYIRHFEDSLTIDRLHYSELRALPAAAAREIAGTAPDRETLSKRETEISKLMESAELSNRDMRRLNRLIRRDTRSKSRRESLELFPSAMEIDDSARVRSMEYWEANRPVPLTEQELASFREFEPDTMDEYAADRQTQRLIRQLILGGTHNFRNRLRLSHNGLAGPSSFYYNTVDGLPYSKTMTLDHRPEHGRFFSLGATVTYAFARDRLMADANLRYEYDPYKRAYVAFAIGRKSTDFNDGNGIPLFFNTISTLLLKQNHLKLYEMDFIRADHRIDLANGLVLFTGAEFALRRRLINNSFYFITNPYRETFLPNFPQHPSLDPGKLIDHYAFHYKLRLSYTHRHYYRMANNRKVMMHSSFPTVSLMYRQGVRDVWESSSAFRHWEVSVSHRMELRLIGNISYKLTGGFFPQKKGAFFADYRHFDTNPLWVKSSNNIDMFQTPGYYAYSTVSNYSTLHVRYDHSRLLLKRLPVLSDKLLRERLFVNTLLIDGRKPYTEFGYGLDQLLLIFSVDVVSGFSGGKHQYTGFRIGIPLTGQVGLRL
ncbi:MAG: DUF5686 and carboxypeptidase regulatory-like domain-containing protein [Bacteroidales bacterium]|nr:DUF5686 and carboxypeptidase regulatory-like domain-containing protein [Bacteroidales bacterium]